ncbi:MAG TPA: hypothetical protein VE422_11020 [Terriglobia bacterium]|nr:hypothetical protein [Terriglobia bacterium]
MENNFAPNTATISHSPAPALGPVSGDVQLVIPHRTPKLTRAALKFAATLAAGLDIRVRLVDVHIVPYGVPLDEPTVDPKHTARRLRGLLQDSELRVSPEVVYTRDWEQGFRRALGPASVVLMPIQRSWWRTAEKRLAARLRKFGHQVIWVECE